MPHRQSPQFCWDTKSTYLVLGFFMSLIRILHDIQNVWRQTEWNRFWHVISDVLHVISDATEGKKSLLAKKFARCKTGLTECILLLALYRVCYCYNSLVQWVNVFLICTKDIRRNYRYVPLGGAWRCLHICSLIFLFAMYIFDLHIFVCNLVILVWFYFCLDSSCLLL